MYFGTSPHDLEFLNNAFVRCFGLGTECLHRSSVSHCMVLHMAGLKFTSSLYLKNIGRECFVSSTVISTHEQAGRLRLYLCSDSTSVCLFHYSQAHHICF